MKKDDHKILIVGGLLSLLTLVSLAVAHSLGAAFLTLESRWLIMAGIPLLVTLVAGGYITRFKGLGIELESTLQRSVDKGHIPQALEVTLQASDIADEAEVMAKQSLEKLYQLSPEKKQAVKRLSFVMKRHYYPNVIEDYFHALPELHFLEVRDQSGALASVIPRQAITAHNLQRFVAALLKGTVVRDFADVSLTRPVHAHDSFLVAIEKLRNSGLEALPVIEGEKIVGIVDRSSAFERLAEAVVEARLKS